MRFFITTNRPNSDQFTTFQSVPMSQLSNRYVNVNGTSLSQNNSLSGVRLPAGDNLLSSVNQPLVGGLDAGSIINRPSRTITRNTNDLAIDT